MKNTLVFMAMLIAFSISAQMPRILIEGEFNDWEDVPVIYDDAPGDEGSSNIDFGKLWITNDDDFLFLRLEVGKEMNLQSDNEIVIYLDTDNNASTGVSFNGIGAEITYGLGEREGIARLNGDNYNLDHENIGLVTAPTVTSDVFEIAIRRNGSIAGIPLFSNNTIKVAFEDDGGFGGDWLPTSGSSVSYTISNNNLEPLPSFSIPKTGNTGFRVVSYNVLQDGPFESNKAPAFERIFQALQPDIIGFTEIYDHNANQVADLMESFIPSGAGEQWYGAGVNPDIICVSRYKIKQAFIIDGSGNSANGAFLIELPAPFDSDLLFIVAHTPCCGNDYGRQQEIDAINEFIRDAKNGTGDLSLDEETPIIVCGDMNLVGDSQQLESLLDGNIINESTYGDDYIPDWDGTNLEDAIPYTTNTPMAFTWATDFSDFSPGRLDFIIYTGSVLEIENSFNLFTPALSNSDLNANNLQVSDTPVASDHIPVVADFKKIIVSTGEAIKEDNSLKIESIYPNPSNNNFSLKYHLARNERIKAVLYDNLGSEKRVLFDENQSEGEHTYSFSKKELSSGIYWLKLMTEKEIATMKVEIID